MRTLEAAAAGAILALAARAHYHNQEQMMTKQDEIAALVGRAIEQTGAAGEGMRAMGKVMGVVTPQVKGRADGGAVAAEVRRQLG